MHEVHRARRWLPWLWVALLPAGVLVGTALSPDVAWRAMGDEIDARIEALQAELAAERLPAVGEPAAGDAWPQYERARALADFAMLEEREHGEELGSRRSETVAAQGAALAALLDGVRRTRLGRDVPRPDGEAPSALESLALGRLLIDAAADRRDAGDPDRAVALLSAALRFALDLAVSGTLVEAAVSSAVAEEALTDLGTLCSRASIPPACARPLAGFLGEIDAAWPTLGDSFARETTLHAALVHRRASRGELLAEFGVGRLPLWRHLFSERRLALRWWDLRRHQEQLIRDADGQPWIDARIRLAAEPQPDRSDPLAVLAVRSEPFASASRTVRARLRVIRAALAEHPGDAARVLEDPFTGAPLRAADGEAGLRIWSLGPDGVDDGGQGWLTPDTDLDLALELRR
jgi:hypothetical protein